MLTDEDLARGIQRGIKADLTLLVERHHSPLLGFLYRMTGGNRPLAEDLAQETFLRVLRGIGQYQYPRPFKPWLYGIATNLARDHYKQAEMRHTVSMPERTPEIEADVLRYYQELSLAEIADVLNVPVGTVKSRLSLGLKQLRERILERE